MKKFSFTFNLIKTKPPIDFFAQNSLRFGCRAPPAAGRGIDLSLLAAYTENSSESFRRLRRRGSGQKFRTKILNLKTAKEPDKNIGSNHILQKKIFS
jgi:hypothetical protein